MFILTIVTKYRTEHWASIPKVVGSIATVARKMFQACRVWIYTQSNYTNTEKISYIEIMQICAQRMKTVNFWHHEAIVQ
jgi:hypothetical protein